jgi:type I restriction enzyme S subunit
MTWKKIKLGEVIKQRKGFINIDNEVEYKLCRVQVHRKGVVLREHLKGFQINTKKQQVCKAGDFIVAEMDAKVGGYGFIPKELDGAIVSSHYFLFELDTNKIRPQFLEVVSQLKILQEQIKAIGSTNYAAIRPINVLEWEIPFPPIEKQIEIERIFENAKLNVDKLTLQYQFQLTQLENLNQAILQEAVQGKLVSQDPKDEPACELLKRIKAEKAKSGKKEKPLPPIKPEEIPYGIPENWVWCRLGEICDIKGGKRVRNGYKLLKTPTDHIYIRVTDMKNGSISNSDIHYIDQKMFEDIKQYTISKYDLYITIAGTIGEVGEVPEMFDGANLTENAAKFVFDNILLNRGWLRNILSSKHSQLQFLDKTKKVTAQPKLALTRIATTLIPLPPLSEQKRIVAEVEKQLAKTRQLNEHIIANQQATEQLLKALLHQAFEVKGMEQA